MVCALQPDTGENVGLEPNRQQLKPARSAFGCVSAVLVLVAALIVGVCVVSARTTLAAMTQALVPDSQRGRVESAMVTVIGIGTMGALFMAGILGDLAGPESVFVLTGIVVLLAGLASISALRGAEQRLLNGNNGYRRR